MHDGVITGYRQGVGGHVVDLRGGRYNWWIKTRRGDNYAGGIGGLTNDN